MQLVETVEPVVHIVDDNEFIRDSIAELLASVGMKAVVHASAREFLGSYEPNQPGCLILDLRLPGMDGLELQQHLNEQEIGIPIVFLTAHADLAVAVRAMKCGAVDFLTKPFNEQRLLESIKHALDRDAEDRIRRTECAVAEAQLSNLTPRERDVLRLILAGKSNKMVAAELGLSHKTVEFHRSRIMAKSRADSLADLVRMSVLAEVAPAC